MMQQHQEDNEGAKEVEARIAGAGGGNIRHGAKLGTKRGGRRRHEPCFRVASAKIVASSFACILTSRLGSRVSKDGTPSRAWMIVSAITPVLKRRNSPARCPARSSSSRLAARWASDSGPMT